MQLKKCPDCNGELESGCIIDHTYGSVLIQRYVKAEVPKNNKSVFWIRETDFSDVRRVITYRCVSCNRLFNYAQDFLSVSNEKIIKTNKSALLIKVAIIIGTGLLVYIFGLVIGNN